MTEYVKMNDHRQENGRLNWESYEKAQIENGEKCSKCKAYLTFARGYSQICHQCVDITSSTESAEHNFFVRCPRCENVWKPEEYDVYDNLFECSCIDCNFTFDVEIEVKVTFISPPIEESDD